MRIWQTEMILFSFFTEKGVRSVLTFLVHKNFVRMPPDAYRI